ncbi:MAG: DUF58 domain-containing protein [Calditrichaeota bacterium]|nr:MAG: DUF58 domain-containing protein [Calditrichota bacterium]MBL1205371.1 DUF58 domain-containing protein [Calditrichota bacterium]NOG45200.1 DUF58 domain-containing protein [Calditrichota bacterium]
MIIKFIKSFYLQKRFFYILSALVILFIAGFNYASLYAVAKFGLGGFILITIFDTVLLFHKQDGIFASRKVPSKLSNGDENQISVEIENYYNFEIYINVIDEIPAVFQVRNFNLFYKLQAGKSKRIKYSLFPVKRGDYVFGFLNIFVSSTVGLVGRKYSFDEQARALVYPSIIQMQMYELYAISNRLTEAGIKKIRSVGHTLEFDQIRNYVKGDDYRTINWKATARRRDIMVNQYQDEKAQQVFSVIDMGRNMKMPFKGMSLLDYAINSSLVISNIAIRKHDKAGLLTFSNNISSVLPASGHYSHMNRILEALYSQSTGFLESDFEKMYATIRMRIKQRSLILLFTNFESLQSLERQMLLLSQINKSHALVVILFENSELTTFRELPAKTTEEIYKKVIAEKLIYEKRQIVKELRMAGIQSILVQPQELTISVINKYLELKARAII